MGLVLFIRTGPISYFYVGSLLLACRACMYFYANVIPPSALTVIFIAFNGDGAGGLTTAPSFAGSKVAP